MITILMILNILFFAMEVLAGAYGFAALNFLAILVIFPDFLLENFPPSDDDSL